MQLAVDALENAAVRNMSWATLLLGDLDFQPLIVALVRFGVRVIVYHEAGAREELLEVADERHPLTLSEYAMLAPATFASSNVVPTFAPVGAPGYPVPMKKGHWNGHEVVLSGHGTADSLAPPYELFVEGGDESNGQSVGVRLNTPDAGHRLAQAFELGYGGEIKWR